MILQELRELLEGVLGAIPARSGRLLRRLYYAPRFAACGRDVSIGEGAEIACPAGIRLGDRVYLGRGIVLRACVDAAVSIGSDFAANGNVRLIADLGGSIEIGDKVRIGPNCVLRASDHAFDRPDAAIRDQGHRPGRIVVGSDVWIGANAVIVRGAVIGDHAVIGAGSVVTGEIPPWAVAAGAPARVIRMREHPGGGAG